MGKNEWQGCLSQNLKHWGIVDKWSKFRGNKCKLPLYLLNCHLVLKSACTCIYNYTSPTVKHFHFPPKIEISPSHNYVRDHHRSDATTTATAGDLHSRPSLHPHPPNSRRRLDLPPLPLESTLQPQIPYRPRLLRPFPAFSSPLPAPIPPLSSHLPPSLPHFPSRFYLIQLRRWAHCKADNRFDPDIMWWFQE